MINVNSRKAAIKSGTQYNTRQNHIQDADNMVGAQITDYSLIRNRRHSFEYLKSALRTTTTSTIANLLTP